jgi:hypothetical protein
LVVIPAQAGIQFIKWFARFIRELKTTPLPNPLPQGEGEHNEKAALRRLLFI